jgi:hypothetical protein
MSALQLAHRSGILGNDTVRTTKKAAGYEPQRLRRPTKWYALIPIPSHSFSSSGVRQVQLREHSERITPGTCVNLFQAPQQASTICS